VAAAALGSLAAGTPAVAAPTPTAVRVVQAAPLADPGATVTTADGRTLTVTGFPTSQYRANAEHRTAVVQLAAGTGGMSGNAPGAPQQPNAQDARYVQTQTPGYDPNGVHTQAGAGTLSATAVAALVMGVVLYFGIKNHKVTKGWAIACVGLGVLLSPTFVGPLVTQLTGSGASTFGNLWSGL
jgi:hypothetical protein